MNLPEYIEIIKMPLVAFVIFNILSALLVYLATSGILASALLFSVFTFVSALALIGLFLYVPWTTIKKQNGTEIDAGTATAILVVSIIISYALIGLLLAIPVAPGKTLAISASVANNQLHSSIKAVDFNPIIFIINTITSTIFAFVFGIILGFVIKRVIK